MALCVIIAITVLTTGFGSSMWVKENRNDIDEAMGQFLFLQSNSMRPTSGFPSHARLTSISRAKQKNADKVTLRVEANKEPGYYRAMAYDMYGDGEWLRPASTQTLIPDNIEESAERALQTFTLRSGGEMARNETKVWPDASLRNTLFLPMTATTLAAPTFELEVDDYRAVHAPRILGGAPYEIQAEDSYSVAEALEGINRGRCLEIPSELDPRVKDLAESIFQGKDTPLKKVSAVVQYFSGNYTYELGIRVPKDVEPLSWFLLEKPNAHCEFFAAGAAILLRLGDIPTRYVTGFVVAKLLFKTPLGLVLFLVAAPWLIRRRLKRKKRRRREEVLPQVLELKSILKKMDKQIRRKGLVREPEETLTNFARRIDKTDETAEWGSEAANWYRDYARTRFRGAREKKDLERLRKTCAKTGKC